MDMGGDLGADAGPKLFEFPRNGREGVVVVGKGARNVAMTEEAAEGGFGEAAGVRVGLVELATDFSGGNADGELLH